MIVDIPDNNIIFEDSTTKELYFILNKAFLFEKDTELVVMKKLGGHFNQPLVVTTKVKFEERFHKLRSITLETNENR